MSYTYGNTPTQQLTPQQVRLLRGLGAAADVAAMQSGIIQIPREFGPADLQIQAPVLQSGTGINQIIIIFGVLGLGVGLMYIFFNMFKI